MHTFSVTIRKPLLAAGRVVQVTAEYYALGDGSLYFYSPSGGDDRPRPSATFAAGAWQQVIRDTDIDRVIDVDIELEEAILSSLLARGASKRAEQALQDELAAS